MYFVGGDHVFGYEKQITILESCQLRKIGRLPYDFELGACNNFRDSDSGNEIALLCFGQTKTNESRPTHRDFLKNEESFFFACARYL